MIRDWVELQDVVPSHSSSSDNGESLQTAPHTWSCRPRSPSLGERLLPTLRVVCLLLMTQLLLVGCGPEHIVRTVDGSEIPEITQSMVGESVVATEIVREMVISIAPPEGPLPEGVYVEHDGAEWFSLQVGNRSFRVTISHAQPPFCENEQVPEVGRSLRPGDQVEVFGELKKTASISPCESVEHYVKKLESAFGMWR